MKGLVDEQLDRGYIVANIYENELYEYEANGFNGTLSEESIDLAWKLWFRSHQKRSKSK